MDIIPIEGLEIAQAYLQNKSSVEETALAMNLPVETVAEYLAKKEVRTYLDQIYLEGGFRNRERMGALMDEIIAQKLEEMEDTGMGSNKDIIEILKIAHDMKMKELELQAKLANASTPATAIQINNNGDGWNNLIGKLTE